MKNEEIKNLIQEIIEKTMVPVKEISIIEDGPKTTWFRVSVAEPHFFIGRDGEALSALNHLVRRMVEAQSPTEAMGEHEHPSFLVDINDFQKQKVDAVRATAHMMAERARYFKSKIEVDAMSAFDRRIVHEFLSDATDLKTESEGLGPNRHVVIIYTGEL